MDTTLWQSTAWADYQRALGREVRTYGNGDASALVIIDRTAGGFSTWEIPRGPVVSEKFKVKSEKYDELLNTIIADAKKDKCIALYLSPFLLLSTLNFQLSTRHVHPQATRIIDLTRSEDDILAQMHPKGRYNIGVARKHGITVRKGAAADIDAFYGLLTGTGGRDGFRISQKSHYSRFLTDLRGSFLLLAELQGKPIAGLLGVTWNGTGIYYYGASSYEDRQLMAPYLLQWEAMRWCKANGCTQYDLFGIEPEENSKIQESKSKKLFGIWNLEFGSSQRSWAGITDFKRKFGGTVVTYPPEQMIVLKPMVKAALDLKRKIFG